MSSYAAEQLAASPNIWSAKVVPFRRPTVLIADPAWKWTGGKSKAPKYETVSIKGLHALAPAVKELAGKDSLMLMWCTIPTLADAIALLATWGYAYKSAHVWKKPKIGTGFYSRNNVEIVLIGRRGRPGVPAMGQQEATIFEGAPLEKRHSSKPDWLHKWVERHYASAEKIELFARVNRFGWKCIGADLGTLVTPAGIVHKDQCLPPSSEGEYGEKIFQEIASSASSRNSVQKSKARSRRSSACQG